MPRKSTSLDNAKNAIAPLGFVLVFLFFLIAVYALCIKILFTSICKALLLTNIIIGSLLKMIMGTPFALLFFVIIFLIANGIHWIEHIPKNKITDHDVHGWAQ